MRHYLDTADDAADRATRERDASAAAQARHDASRHEAPPSPPRTITRDTLNMGFAIRNLAVASYAQGFTVWVYSATSATRADVEQTGFFNQAIDMMGPGDHIHVHAPTWGGLARVYRKCSDVRISWMGVS